MAPAADCIATRSATRDVRGRGHRLTRAERRGTCKGCHPFDAQMDAGTPPLAAEASAAALYPSTPPCHFSPAPSDTRIPAAPSPCTPCHSNMAPLLPENHQVAWL